MTKQTTAGNLEVTGTVTAAYKSSDASSGITQSVVILDGDGVTTHTLTFKDGLLVTYATA